MRHAPVITTVVVCVAMGASIAACTLDEADDPSARPESDTRSDRDGGDDGLDGQPGGDAETSDPGLDDAGDGSAREGGREAGPGTSGCGTAVTPGSSSGKLVVGGAERTYLKDVPASVTSEAPVPLIFGFHGGSDTAENARRYMQLTGTEAAIYVYPQAPYWPEAGGVAWNVDPAGVDFPFIDALVAELGEKHCIDTTRVFATGKSNGGFFVNSLACYRQDVFRGVAVVAGGGPQSQCAKGMAAMIVHGTADKAVRFEQGEFSRDFWRGKNGCKAETTPVSPASCVAYDGCARPTLWCPHDGGHIWPSWAGAGVRAYFLGL